MKVIKSPNPIPGKLPGIFLAGSIGGSTDGSLANDWQKTVEILLNNENIEIYNPRRIDYDSTWKQTIENDKFKEQVNWELNSLEKATVIILYFSPETQSPISLLELGLHAQSGKLLVCCPEGFWRKGNVDIVCAKYGIPTYNTIEELVGAAIVKINM